MRTLAVVVERTFSMVSVIGQLRAALINITSTYNAVYSHYFLNYALTTFLITSQYLLFLANSLFMFSARNQTSIDNNIYINSSEFLQAVTVGSAQSNSETQPVMQAIYSTIVDSFGKRRILPRSHIFVFVDSHPSDPEYFLEIRLKIKQK
jgi:hypothetical protein